MRMSGNVAAAILSALLLPALLLADQYSSTSSSSSYLSTATRDTPDRRHWSPAAASHHLALSDSEPESISINAETNAPSLAELLHRWGVRTDDLGEAATTTKRLRRGDIEVTEPWLLRGDLPVPPEAAAMVAHPGRLHSLRKRDTGKVGGDPWGFAEDDGLLLSDQPSDEVEPPRAVEPLPHPHRHRHYPQQQQQQQYELQQRQRYEQQQFKQSNDVRRPQEAERLRARPEERDPRDRQQQPQQQQQQSNAQSKSSYEERLREWQRKKDEYDRMVRERDERIKQQQQQQSNRPHVSSNNVPQQQQRPQQRPQQQQQRPGDSEAELERKLQDYVRRITPIDLRQQQRPNQRESDPRGRPSEHQQVASGADRRSPSTYSQHENDLRYQEFKRKESSSGRSIGSEDTRNGKDERQRLSKLPVDARIVIRPNTLTNNASSPTSGTSEAPLLSLRQNFGESITFPGLSPGRRGPEASRFPAPPTRRPPIPSPGPCTWAVVVCCAQHQRSRPQQSRCFEAANCPSWDTNRCRIENVRAANNELMRFYLGQAKQQQQHHRPNTIILDNAD